MAPGKLNKAPDRHGGQAIVGALDLEPEKARAQAERKTLGPYAEGARDQQVSCLVDDNEEVDGQNRLEKVRKVAHGSLRQIVRLQ
jgi:hypothetical protein